MIELSVTCGVDAECISGWQIFKREDDEMWQVRWLTGVDDYDFLSDKFTSRVKAREYVNGVLGRIDESTRNSRLFGNESE